MVTLNAGRCIGVVQGTTARRAAGRRVDDDTPLRRSRFPFNDLVVRGGLRRRASRRDRISLVVADNRTLMILRSATQTQAIFHSDQKPPRRSAVTRDLDQCCLVAFPVDNGVGLAVLAVHVLGHVDGILMSTVAERVALLVCPQRVGAARAVVCMALKGHHDVLLVGLELADQHDGLGRRLDHGGHGAGSSTAE